MYHCLQEGGPEKHPRISAGDKDFPVVIGLLCRYAVLDVQVFSGMQTIYDEEENKAL